MSIQKGKYEGVLSSKYLIKILYYGIYKKILEKINLSIIKYVLLRFIIHFLNICDLLDKYCT